MVTKFPSMDSWGHLDSADSQGLGMGLIRLRKCCFFAGTNNATDSRCGLRLSSNVAHSLFLHIIPFESQKYQLPGVRLSQKQQEVSPSQGEVSLR